MGLATAFAMSALYISLDTLLESASRLIIRQWEVQIKPGGDSVLLNGIVDHVHTEPSKFRALAQQFSLGIRKINSIKYLRSMKGYARNSTSPADCARVSCSYSTGIVWCNDGRNGKTLNSFGSIADSAEYPIAKCTAGSSLPTYSSS